MMVYVFLYVLALLWFSLMFYIIHMIFGNNDEPETVKDLDRKTGKVIGVPRKEDIVLVETVMNGTEVKLIAVNYTDKKKELGDEIPLYVLNDLIYV